MLQRKPKEEERMKGHHKVQSPAAGDPCHPTFKNSRTPRLALNYQPSTVPHNSLSLNAPKISAKLFQPLPPRVFCSRKWLISRVISRYSTKFHSKKIIFLSYPRIPR